MYILCRYSHFPSLFNVTLYLLQGRKFSVFATNFNGGSCMSDQFLAVPSATYGAAMRMKEITECQDDVRSIAAH